MRVVPDRPFGLQVVTFFGLLILGPLAGHHLAAFLLPRSELVQTVSLFAFALVFVGGMMLWMGLGVATVVLKGLTRLARGKPPGPEGLEPTDQIVPSGYRGFVVLGVVMGLGMGILAALLTELPVGTGVRWWTVVGLAYGLGLWAAAHHGYLPFPEPE